MLYFIIVCTAAIWLIQQMYVIFVTFYCKRSDILT